ncbi:hypothetical protein ACQKEM_13010, partial [Pseudomonas sp. NPDC077382]
MGFNSINSETAADELHRDSLERNLWTIKNGPVADCVKTARKRSGRISNAPTGSGRLLSEQKKSA